MQIAQSIHVRWLIAAIAFFLLVISCNKSSDFGSGLIEQDDFLSVRFDQVFSLKGETFLFDSVATFDAIGRLGDSTLVFGSLTDPLFGKVDADVYTLMRPESVDTLARNAQSLICDSIRLDIRIARNLFYGDTLIPFNIGVYRLSEEFPRDTFIYSNRTLPYDPTPIGFAQQVLIKPNSRSPVTDTTSVPYFITIPMERSFGQEILDNKNLLDTIQVFQNFFRGLLIKAESDSPLAGLNLLSSQTRMRIFFDRGDTTGVVTLSIREATLRFANYRYDVTNTLVEEYLDNGQAPDDYIFLQGLSGVRPSLTFPDLSQFQNKSIKVALLEIPIADIPDNAGGIYPPVNQLLCSYKEANGSLRLIDELLLGGGTAGLVPFGGAIRPATINGKQMRIYRMNISRYVQDYLKGRRPDTIIISALNSFRSPERVVLYGPDHPEFPVTLKIIYSDF